ncbi:MAG: DUF971 domain-containing protein [Planctomycetota bacterium]|nr:DUF971 domain-containing protein [Planctomycetota bacterium]
MTEPSPRHLDLQRTRGLNVTWQDGSTSFFSVDHLRWMSPSAEARALRAEMERNPLTVLPSGQNKPLIAEDMELVGSYAVRIRFSDGHDTGLYTWSYLRSLDNVEENEDTS